MKKLLIIFLLAGCTTTPQPTENKKPCKPETTTDKILDTAMAAFILSQGKGYYYNQEDCE